MLPLWWLWFIVPACLVAGAALLVAVCAWAYGTPPSDAERVEFFNWCFARGFCPSGQLFDAWRKERR